MTPLLRALFVGTSMALAANFAHAQLSFPSAIDMALRNDPKIKAAQASITKAKAAAAATRDAFIPTLVAHGGYGKSIGVPLGVPEVFSLSSQSLLFSFSQKDNQRAAAAGLLAANLALDDARAQVTEDVAISYLDLNNAQVRNAAITQESGFASRLVTIVQERLSAGQDTQIELLQARRTAAQIHIQQLQMDDEIAILSNHLARILGLATDTVTTVPDSIPPPMPIVETTVVAEDSPAIRAAFANARAKQELAFGESRYRFRPQITFGATYSRISTSQTNYIDYYPGFNQKSQSATSIGLQFAIPLYDRGHEDRARESMAEAVRARFEAEDQRNQFLDGRYRLQHSANQLEARIELARIERDIAQQQLDVTLLQITSGGSTSTGPQMTPKDEQNARLQERARTIDLLNFELQLNHVRIHFMRQNGQLKDWLKAAGNNPSTPSTSSLVRSQ